MSQIVSVHIGQAGVQIGSAFWELLTLEQGLSPAGFVNECSIDAYCPEENFSWTTFFEETSLNKFVPRAVFIDLEPAVIDEIRNNCYQNLFKPGCMIAGKEDAANNFGRGMYTIGREVSNKMIDAIRSQAEICHNLGGFFIFHSMSGGTGSGLSTLLLQQLSNDYPRQHKQELVIYPCPRLSTSVVDPYNTILSTHGTLESSDCVFMVDNEALYDICSRQLDMERPTYVNLNQIIAQVISTITASLRFSGSVNVNMSEFRTNLVPYPRIHFPLITYSPLQSITKGMHSRLSITQMTRECFKTTNQMLKCDPSRGKYMAICMLYRGRVEPKEVVSSVQHIKHTIAKFVNWCPTGFKIGINYQPPMMVPGSGLFYENTSVCSVANSTAVGETWARVNYKFDLMFSKRAYVHWFLGEGMDEQEFIDARENLAVLEKDYEECGKDNVKDSEDAEADMSTLSTSTSTKRTSSTSSTSEPSTSRTTTQLSTAIKATHSITATEASILSPITKISNKPKTNATKA